MKKIEFNRRRVSKREAQIIDALVRLVYLCRYELASALNAVFATKHKPALPPSEDEKEEMIKMISDALNEVIGDLEFHVSEEHFQTKRKTPRANTPSRKKAPVKR